MNFCFVLSYVVLFSALLGSFVFCFIALGSALLCFTVLYCVLSFAVSVDLFSVCFVVFCYDVLSWILLCCAVV